MVEAGFSTNMFESSHHQPSENEPYKVVVGGGYTTRSRLNLFNRVRGWLSSPVVSIRRKVLVIGVPLGMVLVSVTAILFITMSSSKEPLTVATEKVEGGLKIDTNGDGQPDAVIPQNEETPNNGTSGSAANGGTSQGGTSPGGATGGTTGNGSTGGGSSSEGSTTSCPLPAYPKPSCTGVPSGTTLTSHNGDFATSSAGQVISGLRITGDVEILHSNVVIRNSEIYGHVKNNSTVGSSFSVEDSTIGPISGCLTDAAVGHNNYTINRVHLRNYAEGFRVEEGGSVTVRNSYVKFCNPNVDNHGDAIQGYLGGSNVIFEHNTVDMLSIPVETDYITAVIFWSDSSGNNVQFKDNLISGGSYSIRIHVGTGHTVSGNKVINNSWLYGPVYSNCSAISWSNNSIVEIDASYNITSTIGPLACAN